MPATITVEQKRFKEMALACVKVAEQEKLLRECHFFMGDADRMQHNPERYEKMIRQLAKYPSH